MFHNLQAENLKCRRTFAKKLIVAAPLLMVLIASLSGRYLVQNGYNWWYMLILPGLIALITALINQIEEKKLRYRSVYALPISLRKIWISKVLLIAIYTCAACLIHFAGMLLGRGIINPTCAISIHQMAMATLLMIVVSLWQIPVCLFLSKKFGFMPAILFNTGIGVILNLLTVEKFFWWVCPYSWLARMMCPILGVLPNGTLAAQGDSLLIPDVIPVGVALSVLLFILMLAVTAKWFQKQEVR